MPNLVGGFELDKSNLLSPNCSLVIGTRKKPTAHKPKHYLLHKVSPSKFLYLSSLYPVDLPTSNGQETAQIFAFEVGGIDYLLTIDKAAKRAEISPKTVIKQTSTPTNGQGGIAGNHKEGAKPCVGGGRFQNA